MGTLPPDQGTTTRGEGGADGVLDDTADGGEQPAGPRDALVAAPPGEARSDPRHPIELKVEYKRLNTFFSDYTKNISRGGTFIKTTRPLPIGTEFLFKLFIPKLKLPLVLRGEVQWIVTEGEALTRGRESVAGMGIRFVDMEGAGQLELKRSVEALMVDSLGQLLYSRLMDAGKESH